MKKSILLLLLLASQFSFSQAISRGPEQGEIYFLAPTYTGRGLYHSTNYGETAICVDSINVFLSIAADKTSGGIYAFSSPSILYYSDDFGNYLSWELKYSSIYLSSKIYSGVEFGHIFSGCNMHSNEYGSNFIFHSCNGIFGSPSVSCIDNVNESIGYVLSTKVTVADTMYLFRTYDKFENVELIHKLNYHWSESIRLYRGSDGGEVFMYNFTRNELWYSDDYFDNLSIIDTFNIQYSGNYLASNFPNR